MDTGFFLYNRGVKRFGSRSGRHFVGPDLGPNCLQRLSADKKKSALKGKELNTIQLVAKALAKVISFGSNFFHLAKVLATPNSEPG